MQPSALEAIERANIDIQISTARRFPRSLAVVKTRMMNLATLDEETAASCFYKLARQGKSIDGPSIRLAEIAASSYGNLRFGARVIASDSKQITAQGFCHDLETNVLSTIEIRRRITDKNGRTYSDDMIVTTGNAACAIAARNAIFKVVPFAFVKPIYLAARKAAVGDITTLEDRRSKMLKAFAALGINEKRVCATLEKQGVAEIGLDELETLIGLHNAIRDGDQTVEEAFPAPPTKPQFGAVGEDGKPKDSEEVKQAVVKKEKPKPKPEPPRATPLETLRNLMKSSGMIEDKDLLTHLFGKAEIEQGDTLAALPDEKILGIIGRWMTIGADIKGD